MVRKLLGLFWWCCALWWYYFYCRACYNLGCLGGFAFFPELSNHFSLLLEHWRGRWTVLYPPKNRCFSHSVWNRNVFLFFLFSPYSKVTIVALILGKKKNNVFRRFTVIFFAKHLLKISKIQTSIFGIASVSFNSALKKVFSSLIAL